MSAIEPQIRLMLVDDHPVVRAGLRTVSEVDEAIVIVGEAANASEAMIGARQLRPDALLLDVRLPDRSGLEVCREIKAMPNPPRILFLTSFADNDLVLAAMQAGGDGYLLKNNEPRDIAAALRTIMRGGAIFDPVVTRQALKGISGRPPAPMMGVKTLSRQEMRVLEAVARGLTDKEVAQALGLQTKTARNYLDRVFEKLGVHTRTQAALQYERCFKPSP
jgi:two-component system response regulator DevR